MGTVSQAQALIGAMITPAILILASASLIATALARLARIVDRVRKLVESGDGVGDDLVDRNSRRASLALRAVTLFFAAVMLFVMAGIAIAIDRLNGDRLGWLPVSITLAGMSLIVVGAGAMVVESHLSGLQVRDEIAALRRAVARDPR